ncbi:mechanosensitive ion channel family protein [Aestuariibacter halophilus]|uniref:Mechanosensitive ion channel family protein n=1 Tax=Fluctibacter halophilus TaxID=226011 RepID=A0ABS8GAJ6_9ALTE|nr:mechanosensitive ion channel family protein [Aestuariibacter halophilus]MCC2617585.1 mechanosensitive ion channel family protein [Aestuariibacter halophilus]
MDTLLAIFNSKVVLTILIPLLLLSIKYLAVKGVRKRAKSKREDRRDLVNNIKNFLNFLMIILLLGIWASEIQQFALSIAAFAVAIVLATREFIQCLIGFFYLISTRPFRIGDWIQVGEFVGEVNATDWIKTTLLEVDLETYQYTGKTLFIPNNKLISSAIKNLNFLKRYATHRFTIVRDESVNPFVFLDELLAKANSYCEDFHDVAVRYNQIIERRLDVKITGPDPSIRVATSELGDTEVEFTIFCPTDRALEIEHALTADFMHMWFAQKALLPAS